MALLISPTLLSSCAAFYRRPNPPRSRPPPPSLLFFTAHLHLDGAVIASVRSLLFFTTGWKTQKQVSLLLVFLKRKVTRSLPTLVLNKATAKLSTIFGYNLKELQRSRPSSNNQARSSQSSVDLKSYIITSQLDPGVYKKHVEDTTKSNLTGFAFVVIGIVHLAGGKITEESLWHHLGRLGMSQNDERHTDFGNIKQTVETLVQQRYLQKDKSNGPEGLTLFYELAERGLDATLSSTFKDSLSQIVTSEATAIGLD
ncbi:unnamed protein product [Lactuca saligna]|uniref:MAGE domain-containing protein n=1 Tax=Lactuca saligna TaxID=75948 RepID=A0AA36EG82_LACSI|nr:unnamed protein product [Lactuca saligna]